MARTTSVISSQYGDFLILDDDGYNTSDKLIGIIRVEGPYNFTSSFQYNTRRREDDQPPSQDNTCTTCTTCVRYIEHSAALTAAVNSVNTKINDITQTRIINELVRHNGTLSDLRDDVRVLKLRGENENLGIYTNYVCKICEDDRALFVSSLKETGTLDQVLAERRNPGSTSGLQESLPGFL